MSTEWISGIACVVDMLDRRNTLGGHVSDAHIVHRKPTVDAVIGIRSSKCV